MRDVWNGSSGRRIAGLGLTAVLASHSFARETGSIPVAAAPVLEDRYPARVVHFPGGVTGSADLVYSTIEGFRPLTLDIYVPRRAKSAPPAPLVVFVHGGAWRAGHSRQSGAFANWPGVLASLAARGYVVSSVNYRLSGEAPFPAALSDVKNAIRWLRARAGEFGIDRDRVLIWGNSAGGELAALTAVSCDLPALAAAAPVSSDSDCVQGAVAWYGMFDFSAAPLDDVSRRYLGCGADPCDAARIASPVTHVRAAVPPFLLVHGVDDRTVPAMQSEAFSRALTSAGARAELLLIPGADHSFIGATADATRRNSHLALQRTFDFIAATLNPDER